ncbi:MAG: PHP domain-containing protein [Eubacteriales bacterium]
MGFKVDYHMHSYFSDGALSPTELVKRAKNLELTEIAVTDHETLTGIAEAQIAGDALDINVISGVEIEAEYAAGVLLHILGYKFDVENKELNELLDEFAVYRDEYNAKILPKLEEMGYPLSWEELINHPKKKYVSKGVIAQAMARKGYVSKFREAFSKIFSDERIANIEKQNISIERVMEVLLAAGATISWAHPMKTKGIGKRGSAEFYQNIEKILADLKKMGLKGLECYHPNHSDEEALELVMLASKYHLHITNGSDYHGEE